MLAEAVGDCLGPLAACSNDFTAAGLRQDLQSDAKVIVLDETERNAASGKLNQIIEFARLTSSSSGARSVRGTVSGQAVRSQTTTAFLLCSVGVPDLAPQDASRITQLDLQEIADKSALSAVQSFRQWAKSHMPALWARMIQGRERLMQNLDVWRATLLAHGCSQRQADQIGVLLSAYYTMVSDEVITPAIAQAELPRYANFAKTQKEERDESGPFRCLGHLLSIMIEFTERRRPTISWLINEVRTDGSEAQWAAKILFGYGIKVLPQNGGLQVSNRDPNLKRLFVNTPWADFGWGAELKRLPGATAPKNGVRMAEGLSRVTVIPFSIFEDDTCYDVTI